MGQYTFNKKQITDRVRQVVNKRSPYIRVQFAKSLLNTKINFVQKLDQHPISKELSAGPNAQSSILNRGNLFSFLGFYAGNDPYQKLKNYIYDSISLKQVQVLSVDMFDVRLKVTVNIPNRTEIEKVTPLAWDDSRSWVRGLEFTGYDNFAYYLYSETRKFKNSRSSTAIQTKKQVGNIQNVAPMPYVTDEIKQLKNFLRRVGK